MKIPDDKKLRVNSLMTAIDHRTLQVITIYYIEFKNSAFSKKMVNTHFFRPVGDWLDQIYPSKWIGRDVRGFKKNILNNSSNTIFIHKVNNNEVKLNYIVLCT